MIQQTFIVIKSVEPYILILDEQINERMNSLSSYLLARVGFNNDQF